MQFRDKVKIKRNADTEKHGVDGLVGVIYGRTTPSIIPVEVIGTLREDVAFNVFFEEKNRSYWFSRENLEILL